MRFQYKGKRVLALALGLVMAATSVQAAEITLRMGLGSSPNSPDSQASRKLAELAHARSNGEITIKVFDSGKLGGSESQIENMQLGTQEMHANTLDWFQKLEKNFATIAMPFLFTGNTHMQKFQQTEEYKQMIEDLRVNHGLRILADNWYRLPKVLVTKTPVFSPDDLMNVKLRMPNLPTYVDTWAAFGAKPTAIAWKEAYLAMKTGTVEGMDAPLQALYPEKFYQAAKYVLMTRHLTGPYTALISEKAWQKLDANQQKIITQAARDAGDFYTKLIEDGFAKQKAEMMADGTVFVEVGVDSFVEKVSATMLKFEASGKWSEGMVAKIKGLN